MWLSVCAFYSTILCCRRLKEVLVMSKAYAIARIGANARNCDRLDSARLQNHILLPDGLLRYMMATIAAIIMQQQGREWGVISTGARRPSFCADGRDVNACLDMQEDSDSGGVADSRNSDISSAN